jgi:hypothetical protein
MRMEATVFIRNRRIPRLSRTGKNYAVTATPVSTIPAGGGGSTMGDTYWQEVGIEGEDEGISYIRSENSVRVQNRDGEAYVEIATRTADTAPEAPDPNERRVHISPEGLSWSENVETALLEVFRVALRRLVVAGPAGELQFDRAAWPVPAAAKFVLALTSETEFDSTPTGSPAAFRWVMHHALQVLENVTFGKELQVGKQLTCNDALVVSKKITGLDAAEIRGDLKVGGDITAPLASASKKGVISVSVTGSGKFLIDASISGGVLTLTRGSATVAELIAMLKAAGVSCSNILSNFGCSCSSAGCSCSAQGCYTSCSSCCSCSSQGCSCSSCCTDESVRAGILDRFRDIEGFPAAFAACEEEIRGAQGEAEAREAEAETRVTKECANKVEDANILFDVLNRKIEMLEARIKELEGK